MCVYSQDGCGTLVSCVCSIRMVVVLYGLFLLGILKKRVVYPFIFKLLNSVWVQYTLEGYNIVLLLDPSKVCSYSTR